MWHSEINSQGFINRLGLNLYNSHHLYTGSYCNQLNYEKKDLLSNLIVNSRVLPLEFKLNSQLYLFLVDYWQLVILTLSI
jgi:hypothetical protein